MGGSHTELAASEEKHRRQEKQGASWSEHSSPFWFVDRA
jgi:hypothetical protein